MTILHRALLTASAVALLPIMALAEDAPPPVPPAAAVEGTSNAYDFDTDEVTVDVLKPDATMVEVLAARGRTSLIRIRMDFVKEIVRSAEDL
jgi:hypothetical protein